MGRVATGLALIALLLPVAARSTTAPSLSDRVFIDGSLDEYAPDEWVLDVTSLLPETNHDSRWGRDNDISRVAITWDHRFLYLAVEFRSHDSQAIVLVSNRSGGLASLDDTGTFRRAIDMPGIPINLVALASPGRPPEVARVDAAHPFSLVDRATLPAAVIGDLDGRAGVEMAIPWSIVVIDLPVRIVGAITGEVGQGAGDSAPDASAVLDPDRYARASLDRWLVIDADLDDDDVADSGVSPRAAVVVEPDAGATRPRDDATLAIDVTPRAFAPDRGEFADLSFSVGSVDEVYVTCEVYSINGTRVRTLFADALRTRSGTALIPDPRDRWDGTNESGVVVRGGAYVVAAQWGLSRSERSGRATAAAVVVR